MFWGTMVRPGGRNEESREGNWRLPGNEDLRWARREERNLCSQPMKKQGGKKGSVEEKVGGDQ